MALQPSEQRFVHIRARPNTKYSAVAEQRSLRTSCRTFRASSHGLTVTNELTDLCEGNTEPRIQVKIALHKDLY
eukprot:4646098-Amphidinium_carterae.3